MQFILKICLSSMLLWLPFAGMADTFEKQASYTVCFTPGQDCTSEIVNVVNNAISNIWVQAYSFTAKPIAKALIEAKQRGVNVQVILDKEDLLGKNNIARFFAQHNIPVWIDDQPAIAHNKVIVVDQTQVITGSFNFTNAAQYQNAENLLIIYDEGLARKYLANWQTRLRASKIYKSPVYATATSEASENWLAEFWQWLVQWVNKFLRFAIGHG